MYCNIVVIHYWDFRTTLINHWKCTQRGLENEMKSTLLVWKTYTSMYIQDIHFESYYNSSCINFRMLNNGTDYLLKVELLDVDGTYKTATYSTFKLEDSYELILSGRAKK